MEHSDLRLLLARTIPIEKIGVYVPGGKASYPSSVLMNCIPAIVAGVPEIFMTVPSLNKKINPGILFAAIKCGVKKIYKLGGAQAVAAFAYGTSTVEKVDKIIGISPAIAVEQKVNISNHLPDLHFKFVRKH